MKNDINPKTEIDSMILLAKEKGYEVLEIQGTMGDIITVAEQSLIYGLPFRLANQIAIICINKKSIA